MTIDEDVSEDHEAAIIWRQQWRGVQLGRDQFRDYCADCLRPIVVPEHLLRKLMCCDACA